MRRSLPVFCPLTLWAEAVDNRGILWTGESSAHPMHRKRSLLPSPVPSFTQLPHRPTEQLRVTPFTRHGERARRVAEQWTGLGRSCAQLAPACGPPVDNSGAALWTRSCPQSVESLRPRIHNLLTWPDEHSAGSPVDTIWTTRQSPGCGRRKGHRSVENARTVSGNRTAGVGEVPSTTPWKPLGGFPEAPPATRRALRNLSGAPLKRRNSVAVSRS